MHYQMSPFLLLFFCHPFPVLRTLVARRHNFYAPLKYSEDKMEGVYIHFMSIN